MEMQGESDFLVSHFVNCSEKQKDVFKGLGTFFSGLFSALSMIFQKGWGIAEASHSYKCFPAVWHQKDLSGLEGKSIQLSRGRNRDPKGSQAGTLKLECARRSPGDLVKMQDLIQQVWGGD